MGEQYLRLALQHLAANVLIQSATHAAIGLIEGFTKRSP